MICASRKQGMLPSKISWMSLRGPHSTSLFTWITNWREDSSSWVRTRSSVKLKLLLSYFAAFLVAMYLLVRIRTCSQTGYSTRLPYPTMPSSVWSNVCRLNAVITQSARWKLCLQTSSNRSKPSENLGNQCAMETISSMTLSSMSRFSPVVTGLSKKHPPAPFHHNCSQSKASLDNSTLTNSRIGKSCGHTIMGTLSWRQHIWRKSIS